MKFSRSILILGLFIFNIVHSQSHSRIKTDGIYRWVDHESRWQVAENLRFFNDGEVIKQITTGESEYNDASYFNKSNYEPVTYEIVGDKVIFSYLLKDSVVLRYECLIKKNKINALIQTIDKNNNLLKEKSSQYQFQQVAGLDKNLIKGKSEANKEVKDDINMADILMFAEIMPEFPGGKEMEKEFIKQNLIYPDELQKKKIEGNVYVSFVIEKDGSLSNIDVFRSSNDLFSEEAIKVLEKMPKWIPGKQKGKLVRVKVTRPIRFKLE